MAGATGLILSFLAGVMVGRGVDQGAAEVQAARPVQDERIVTEEAARPAPSAPALTYAQRLETDRTEERLERVKPSPAPTVRPTAAPPAKAAAPSPMARIASAATPPPGAARPPAAEGAFALQVGAFKDRATAESMVARLKGNGFSSYLVTPQAGLFNVRVGPFANRAEAETAQTQLRAQKFDPFVVKSN